MASRIRKLSYGSVEIYPDQVLGVGAYGKVCKAICGQLPCAAKLLHDSLFWDKDPGIHNLTGKFQQECDFLSTIKHPNIVQYLGTVKDNKAKGLPVLLMELMDEDLTNFLNRSTDPLPYYTQLNICHDVALALSYLHSNDIIHRDLSSNNVLLIGEGSRAKVTDFGMSKLMDMNLKTQLTQAPGTPAYMPPEALTTPPHYSSQLDCFSHGVLTLQIITRNFPDPGDATTTIKDKKSPTGLAFVPISEVVRRKNDIDLIEPSHPLLPIVLNCLKDREKGRPSAYEVCERLASIKREQRSVEQTRSEKLDFERITEGLQKTIAEKDKTIAENEIVLEKCLQECNEQKQVIRQLQLHIILKDPRGEKMSKKREVVSPLLSDLQHSENNQSLLGSAAVPLESAKFNLKWRRGELFPKKVTCVKGASVVDGNTIYIASGHDVYSYTLFTNEWTELTQHQCSNFGMMALISTLTSIGGCLEGKPTRTLYSLVRKSWDEVLPPMTTDRVHPAVANTTTHLIVAGGTQESQESALATVEILNINDSQWYTAGILPVCHPEMTMCNSHFYCSEGNSIFSCTEEDLLKFRTDAWKRLSAIPAPNNSSLASVRGHILAVGGTDDPLGGNPTGAIHCYDAATDSWSAIGEMPTPRYHVLTAVLPSNELVVLGGYSSLGHCNLVDIGSLQ